MVKVKVCGLSRLEDIEAVNVCLPDFAGFVFAPSRRRVTAERAAALIAGLDPAIVPVGVFVNEDVETVCRIAKECRLGAVQLHGQEDQTTIAALRQGLPAGVRVIKALAVRDDGFSQPPAGLDPDFLLLDAYSPDMAGGTGKTFNWNAIGVVAVPCLLAGGLHAGNVAEAIAKVNPWGVDVSSGVETGGCKDRVKIIEFVRKARSVNP